VESEVIALESGFGLEMVLFSPGHVGQDIVVSLVAGHIHAGILATTDSALNRGEDTVAALVLFIPTEGAC